VIQAGRTAKGPDLETGKEESKSWRRKGTRTTTPRALLKKKEKDWEKKLAHGRKENSFEERLNRVKLLGGRVRGREKKGGRGFALGRGDQACYGKGKKKQRDASSKPGASKSRLLRKASRSLYEGKKPVFRKGKKKKRG